MGIYYILRSARTYTQEVVGVFQTPCRQLDTELLDYICLENEKDIPRLVGK